MQKVILLILQRSTKNFTLITGGLFVGSLEGFATVKNIIHDQNNIFNNFLYIS